MSEFFVGQKVVCVNDNPRAFLNPRLSYQEDGLHGLKKGSVYTIRELVNHADGSPGARVAEIRRPYHPVQSDSPYSINRFRPLEETSKTIEQFREIARGVSNGKPIIEDAEWRMPTPEKVKA